MKIINKECVRKDYQIEIETSKGNLFFYVKVENDDVSYDLSFEHSYTPETSNVYKRLTDEESDEINNLINKTLFTI
jgi:hypothetical protein